MIQLHGSREVLYIPTESVLTDRKVTDRGRLTGQSCSVGVPMAWKVFFN